MPNTPKKKGKIEKPAHYLTDSELAEINFSPYFMEKDRRAKEFLKNHPIPKEFLKNK
jgi:hypothetical protein